MTKQNHVEENYTIFVDTGGGGYSYTYGSEEVFIKDMKEDPHISSNCYKKLKKWLENRGKRHNNNIFRCENLRVEI